jgi:hypothetical protein
MYTSFYCRAALFLALMLCAIASSAYGLQPPASSLDRDISRLVRQLNDDRAARRDEAEVKLIELALGDGAGSDASQSDRFLELLPEPTDQMPPAVRERLARIRKTIEERTAQAAVAATTVTLKADAMPLAEVLAAIEQQTGNRLIDNRGQFGQEETNVLLTFDFEDEPFWSAIDQILDQAELGIYNFAGEDALALVAKDEGAAPRHGRAVVSGPFRFEVVEIQGQRNLRLPEREALKLGLEVAWEPRLRPIALTQSLADMKATGNDGQPLVMGTQSKETQQPVLQIEVPVGSQATELVVPLNLPPRSVTEIASLNGTLRALVPGRQATFRFDDLAAAEPVTQSQAGVAVTLDAVRQNNAIWELHMRMQLEEDNEALQSHRGWAFQNVTYLVGEDGQPIDPAGMETTRQTETEVGIVYLFDLEAGVEGLSWVYETPAAIVELPVEFELTDIPLP